MALQIASRRECERDTSAARSRRSAHLGTAVEWSEHVTDDQYAARPRERERRYSR